MLSTAAAWIPNEINSKITVIPLKPFLTLHHSAKCIEPLLLKFVNDKLIAHIVDLLVLLCIVPLLHLRHFVWERAVRAIALTLVWGSICRSRRLALGYWKLRLWLCF